MPYTPTIDIDTFYTPGDLTWYFEHYGHTPWAVHVIGPDEVHTHWDPELPEDDPENFEFTQRTALKWAMEHNAWSEKMRREDPKYADASIHCVVLHHGEPWRPDPDTDGPVDEYCEWFDFDACEWFCNLCFEVIKDGAAHCPTCAPTRFAGLKRLECDENPAHPALFMYADNLDGYNQPNCFYCQIKATAQYHAKQEHARHLRWYRWRVTQRLLPVLKWLRLVRSWCWTSSATCDGCTSIRWRWTR